MKSLTLTQYRPDIGLLTIDMPGSSANVLTTGLFGELDEALEALSRREDLIGLIVYSGKESIFVAGADLKRIVATLDWPDHQITRFCEEGRRIMSMLSQMPFATVAAIHGACVGGGLELALWCDRRIASDDRKTILGLPEVKLGLVPGWAGTVRLPRISNLETAIDLVTSGRSVGGYDALRAGFVDRVVAREALLESAAAMIEAESRSHNFRETRAALQGPVRDTGYPQSLEKHYRATIRENHSVFPHAPEIVLEHLLATADQLHDDACDGESAAMAKVYGSDPSYGLLNHYFLGEHNRRNPGWVDLKLADRTISRVGIVGAGLMGTSIAEVCLQRKCQVVLLDASLSAMTAAKEKLSHFTASDGLTFAEQYAEFADCELVIESVVEVADVKKMVLRQIEASASDRAIIGTNTSAIPLAKLSVVLNQPERLCGIHFCHPQLMQLVEIVKGADTSAKNLADVTQWVRHLVKMPVVVRDHAGFVVNRLLAAMLDQSFRLLGWGCRIEQIDHAMRAFGFRAGPFEIVDIIGSDTCLYAGREMYDAGIQCVTMSPILPRMVKQHWLGRKSLTGFYRYDRSAGPAHTNERLDPLLSTYVDRGDRRELDDAQCVDSICSVIVLEASRILDEGIVASPRDIDLCIINGFSFPPHVGGILFWADRNGLEHVNSILRQLAGHDARLAPSDRLNRMQLAGDSFYNPAV